MFLYRNNNNNNRYGFCFWFEIIFWRFSLFFFKVYSTFSNRNCLLYFPYLFNFLQLPTVFVILFIHIATPLSAPQILVTVRWLKSEKNQDVTFTKGSTVRSLVYAMLRQHNCQQIGANFLRVLCLRTGSIRKKYLLLASGKQYDITVKWYECFLTRLLMFVKAKEDIEFKNS
jgi:hypothetical protein